MSHSELESLENLISTLHTMLRKVDVKDELAVDAIKTQLADAYTKFVKIKPKSIYIPQTRSEEVIS